MPYAIGNTPYAIGHRFVLRIRFSSRLNDQLRGLYRSRYIGGDGSKQSMAVTQFESTDARRAVPCFDEHAFKATWRIAVSHRSSQSGYHGPPAIGLLGPIGPSCYRAWAIMLSGSGSWAIGLSGHRLWAIVLSVIGHQPSAMGHRAIGHRPSATGHRAIGNRGMGYRPSTISRLWAMGDGRRAPGDRCA